MANPNPLDLTDYGYSPPVQQPYQQYANSAVPWVVTDPRMNEGHVMGSGPGKSQYVPGTPTGYTYDRFKDQQDQSDLQQARRYAYGAALAAGNKGEADYIASGARVVNPTVAQEEEFRRIGSGRLNAAAWQTAPETSTVAGRRIANTMDRGNAIYAQANAAQNRGLSTAYNRVQASGFNAGLTAQGNYARDTAAYGAKAADYGESAARFANNQKGLAHAMSQTGDQQRALAGQYGDYRGRFDASAGRLGDIADRQLVEAEGTRGYEQNLAAIGSETRGYGQRQGQLSSAMEANARRQAGMAGRFENLSRGAEGAASEMGATYGAQRAAAGQMGYATGRQFEQGADISNAAGRTMAAGEGQLGQAATAGQQADLAQRAAGEQAAWSQRVREGTGLYETAAEGRQPSVAEIQQQQGLNQAVKNQLALAASTRGPSAGYRAQQGIGDLQSNAIVESAKLRAAEMAQARQDLISARAGATSATDSAAQGQLGAVNARAAAAQAYGGAGQTFTQGAGAYGQAASAYGQGAQTLAQQAATERGAGQTLAEQAAAYGQAGGLQQGALGAYGAANTSLGQASGALTGAVQGSAAAGGMYEGAAGLAAARAGMMGQAAGTVQGQANIYGQGAGLIGQEGAMLGAATDSYGTALQGYGSAAGTTMLGAQGAQIGGNAAATAGGLQAAMNQQRLSQLGYDVNQEQFNATYGMQNRQLNDAQMIALLNAQAQQSQLAQGWSAQDIQQRYATAGLNSGYEKAQADLLFNRYQEANAMARDKYAREQAEQGQMFGMLGKGLETGASFIK